MPSPIGFFDGAAWKEHTVNPHATEKAEKKNVDAAISEHGFGSVEHQNAHKLAQDNMADVNARSGVSKHYNHLTAQGIPGSVAAVRAGAHGVNNATRQMALLARAHPAIASALIVGAGLGAYEIGTKA